MPAAKIGVLGAGPYLRIGIVERLTLGAEVEVGQGLEPAGRGLRALGLPGLDLVGDVLGELLREVVGGVVFADVLNRIIQ